MYVCESCFQSVSGSYELFFADEYHCAVCGAQFCARYWQPIPFEDESEQCESTATDEKPEF